MAKGMVHFGRILTHYILLALERAGVNITSDIRVELRSAFGELESAIRDIMREEMGKRVWEHL